MVTNPKQSSDPSPTEWRTRQAARMSVIVDADDYFRLARAAMLKARHRIMLIGWDFDARIALVSEGREPGEPESVGDFILWLADRTPGLAIHLLRWDVGALKSLFRLSTIRSLIRWMRHDRIHLKLDGHHPTGASHHQKIVVIDDCFAFCGGIDMTAERWDTRCHHDDDPGRRLPGGKLYKPWHDVTTALEGPVAAALGELARDRWRRAGGAPLDPVPGKDDCWPDGLEPDFTDVPVTIARTEPAMPDAPAVHEIEALWLAQIAAARRFIYAESQYFAGRRIAEAIGRRLAEADGPEVVIVNPDTAEGWLQPIAMDSARTRLMAALMRQDVHGRLRMFHPVTAGGAAIYVHAKVAVFDDAVLRIGSANMNNRSMRLDTECDVTITAGDDDARRAGIAAVRDGLIAEHLGCGAGDVAATLAETASLIATIDRLSRPGRALVPYRLPEQNAAADWLADNEVLDPEGPEEMFEPLSRRGLFRRLRRPR